MIYVVTNNDYKSTEWENISIEESLILLNKEELLEFDTETSGLDCHLKDLLCIQFGTKKDQFVIDTTSIDINNYKDILENKMLLGHNLKFDCKFLFTKHIYPRRVYDTMIVEQFLHLGYPTGSIRYSLKEVAYRYLNIEIDKSVRETISNTLNEDIILYAASDVKFLRRIMERQMEVCKKRDCVLGAKLECNNVLPIAYTEYCGIKLDVDKWQYKMKCDNYVSQLYLKKLEEFIICSYYQRPMITYTHSYNKNEFEVEKDFKKMSKYAEYIKEENFILEGTDVEFKAFRFIPPNIDCKQFLNFEVQMDLFEHSDNEDPVCTLLWSSVDQVVELLKILGYNTKTKDKKTGAIKDSASSSLLKGQQGICDSFLDIYLNYKEAEKVCSTYGKAYINAINPKTGRIHTEFHQCGATSSRITCGSSKVNRELALLKNLPTNKQKNTELHCGYPQIQTLPSDHLTRECFICEEGNEFCSCDWSALESRLGADIYNEQEMIKEFNERSGDIHSLVAYFCFKKELGDISIEEIKDKRPDLRKKAKPVGFSQQFGGSARAIANSLGCELEEAESIANAYLDGFKGIADFKSKGSKFVKDNGYILMNKHTGHRLYWYGWEDWKKEKETFTSEFWDNYRLQKEVSSEESWNKNPLKIKVSNVFKSAGKYDRLALNSPTQCTGACCLKDATYDLYMYIIDNNLQDKVKMMGLIHDEILVEYPKELNIDKKLVYFMENSAAKFCKSVKIPAEAAVGNYWIH